MIIIKIICKMIKIFLLKFKPDAHVEIEKCLQKIENQINEITKIKIN